MRISNQSRTRYLPWIQVLVCCLCHLYTQVELEEAIRKGNDKFNSMITDQMHAQEAIRTSAEAEAKVSKGLSTLR